MSAKGMRVATCGPMSLTRARSVVFLLTLAPALAAGCAHAAKRDAKPPAQIVDTSVPAAASAAQPAPDLVCAHGPLLQPTGAKSADDLSCDAFDVNLEPLELSLVCNPVTPSAAVPREPFDHVTAPKNLDMVERRYGLTTEERARLMKNGFVVPSRLSYSSYAPALHDVYRSQLPLYVSVDAVMHAVYRSNDTFIAGLESRELSPRMGKLLQTMHETLATTHAKYGADTARDLDLYLTVARSLLSGEATESALGMDKEAQKLVASARAASGVESVELFGRVRAIDFAPFKPRGHYAQDAAANNPDNADLSTYFLSAMWLSRVEMNLVSRSSRSSSTELDPSETPREDLAAMALADLARTAGVMEEIAHLDLAWSLIAGKREDVSPMAIASMMDEAKISLASPDAAAQLRARIGDGYQRTARTHIQAEGSAVLPAIATLLGPRVTPDSAATRMLVHPEVTDRHEVPMTDIAFALGHDRALAYEPPGASDTTVGLGSGLLRAREITQKRSTGTDLYGGWLNAINALAKTPSGELPTYMTGDSWKDMRMNSAIAAYGQLRHNNILLVPGTYDEPGCEIPESYVEPAPAVYGALIDYADRGARATAQLSPDTEASFLRLGRVLRVLGSIGEHELAGVALSADEQRFLSMVTEISYGRRGGYSSGPAASGWYFEMFETPHDGLTDARLIADYFASPSEGRAFYAGVSEVRMGLFVVDTGGPARVFAGPVARAFQQEAPFAPRLTDSDVRSTQGEDPWAASYTVAPLPEPKLTLTSRTKEDKREGYSGDITFTAVSQEDLPKVLIEITDHHHVPIATVTHELRKGQPVKFVFPSRKLDTDIAEFGAEGVHLQVGEFHYFDSGVFSPNEYAPVELVGARWRFGARKPAPALKAKPRTRTW